MDEPDFTSLAEVRVAIAGLGLMGGSLALALKGRVQEVVGADIDAATVTKACQQGVIDRAAEWPEALDCDVLVLAAPVRGVLSQLADLRRRPEPTRKITVLDLGSTKAEIAAAMRALPPAYDPIGGHPMCGKEVNGLEHADPTLFKDKVFVLVPLERTSPRALKLTEALTTAVGARPWQLTPEQHDRLAALSSHLPYVAAAALVSAAVSEADDEIWTMAASGFRDTSRLAASDVSMMVDILITNRAPLLASLRRYQAELAEITRLIAEGEPEALRTHLAAIRSERRERFP